MTHQQKKTGQKDLADELPTHSNFRKLEGNLVGMAHNTRPDLDQP